MIRGIVAIDKKRGLANKDGIPWDLPEDQKYFREKTLGSTILMGYFTYKEFAQPLDGRQNLVASRQTAPLRNGFIPVSDARNYLETAKHDVWVIGGSRLFEETIDLIEEFYVTEIDRDFNCTKFLFNFESSFQLTNIGESKEEDGIVYNFNIYTKRQLS